MTSMLRCELSSMYLYLHQRVTAYDDMIGLCEPDMALLDSLVECVIRTRFSNTGRELQLTTLLADKLITLMDMPVNLDFPYSFEVDKYHRISELAASLGNDTAVHSLAVELIHGLFYDPLNGMGLMLHNHGDCVWTIIGNKHFTF